MDDKIDTENLYNKLPSVDRILSSEKARVYIKRFGYKVFKESLKEQLSVARLKISSFKVDDLSNLDFWTQKTFLSIKKKVKYKSRRSLINLSGVIIHTNFGRSILADDAIDSVIEASSSYSNLEYDLEKGSRGKREERIENLICSLTSAESAILVNNNAAALLLTLDSLAKKGKVIISRGELIEIGGSFRLPEIIKKSGAKLVEVGTTNRTSLKDYEDAIDSSNLLILKVHKSNYKIVGFTSEVDIKSLSDLAKFKNVPLVVDLGSGAMIKISVAGFETEPTVSEVLKSGAEIVTFSTDKLLGGPQGGLIAGRKDLIDRLKKNHLQRALRVDKMILAALESTLKLYLDEKSIPDSIPTLRFITRSLDDIKKGAVYAKEIFENEVKNRYKATIIEDRSLVGGGSVAELELASYSLAITSEVDNANRISKAFRNLDPPIIGRIESDLFRLDIRTLENFDLFSESLKGLSKG